MSEMLANLAKCDGLPDEAKAHINETFTGFNEMFIALLPDQVFTKEELAVLVDAYNTSAEQVYDKLFAVS